MKKILYFLAISLVFVFSACEDDDRAKAISGSYSLNASASNHWVYFSFEKGDSVQVSDPKNSTDWDIAFSRFMIKTNGGKSGIGQADAAATYFTDQSGFDSIKSVVNYKSYIVFEKDDSVKVETRNPADDNNPIVTTIVLNPVLYKWYNMIHADNKTVIQSKKTVYILKTAKGKYAKMYISSYYGDDNVSGHYKFVYSYQPDGSDNFN